MSTRIDEISDGVYRISTRIPPEAMPGGFTFNQFLIADEEPLLHHSGQRALFPAVRAAIERVLPVRTLRWISLSHFEADECGALNEFLDAAPDAQPVCGQLAAMLSVNDFARRPARALADGEELSLGRHKARWIDTPHVPHAWECGHLYEPSTATLLCGDLFTQGGDEHPPVTEADVLAPSEALRGQYAYYALGPDTAPALEKLAKLSPRTLACMHGASWRGDGAALLRALAATLAGSRAEWRA